MKRGDLCRYSEFFSCKKLAVRTVNQRPYCEAHAVIAERIRRNIEKHKDLLDRLKDD